MATKFTPENRDGILELLADGLSLKDASREVGVREKTVKGWLTRGRKEEDGEYAEFAAAVDSAREEFEQKERPMSEAELLLAVSRAAKKGSVAAQKLLWDMLRASKGDEGGESERSPFDELEPDDEGAKKAG